MVANKVDMSLDDIIASNKRGRGRGGRGGRGFSNNRRGGGGAARGRGNNSGAGGGPIRRRGRGGTRGNRSAPYTKTKNIPGQWEHDKYDGASGRGMTSMSHRSEGLTTGSHLQISNLDFGVTDSDIKELFSEFGKLKKAFINYDETGRSHGTADVVFERKADALKAFNTYNGVPLDGRPMKIEAVTPTVATTVNPQNPVRRNSFRGNNRPITRAGGSRGGNRSSFGRGGSRGQGRGGRGRGQGRRSAPSKDDLDKELDDYIEKTDA